MWNSDTRGMQFESCVACSQMVCNHKPFEERPILSAVQRIVISVGREFLRLLLQPIYFSTRVLITVSYQLELQHF